MILRTGIGYLSRYLVLYAYIILLSKILPIRSFKINTPAVLLAYYNKGLPSNFTLEVTGAEKDECFKYHSSNPKVISVTPLYDVENLLPSCSKKVILSSVANLFERKITEISVTPGNGGKTVYCHVITDLISSIELEYISDELILDGPPQKITVVAKNDKGHKFDSISGLQVEWKVSQNLDESLKKADGEEVIRLSRPDVSDYKLLDNELEKRGLLSTSVLVEPLNLGYATISASLQLSSLPVLHTKEVKMTVVHNLKIYPDTPLYLLRHGSANLKLEEMRNKDVNLGDFTADIEDSNIVRVTDDLSQIQAKDYGKSSIILKNKNFPDSLLNVHAVKLDRIGFRISGGDYNILEQMKIYEFTLDLYDEEGNRMFPSDNIRFSVSFPTKLFHVIYTTSNGTYAIVQAISPGHGKIRVEFKGVVLEDGSISKENTISHQMDIRVCQKLSIFPPYTLLPVLSSRPMYKIPLTVAGGTGNYLWALSDYTVSKIVAKDSKTVELEVYDEIHDLTVTVTDAKNCNFFATAKISIQTPLDIETYPTVTEAQVENVLIVPTALLGYEDKEKDIIRKFDDCSKSNISVDIVEKYVLSYEKEANIPAFGKGCTSLQFKCRMAGFSRVNMQYTVVGKNITFKTTTILSCYKPLKPVYPVRVATNALGASMDVAFEGGPRNWPLYKDGHYAELEATDPDIVKISLIKDPVRYNKDLTVFRVTCKALGENTLTLKIGNNPSATLKHPAKSEASIKFFCANPHSVHLKLYKKKTKRELKDENIVKVPFYGDKSFSVDVYVKDSMGRKFLNISSLRVVWSVSDKSLAYPVSDFDFVTYENAVSGYRKISRNFKEFKMRGSAGDLDVEATVTSYRKEVLAKEGIEEYNETEEISKSLNLKLVSLRDINAGLYDAANENKDENEYCESESCKS